MRVSVIIPVYNRAKFVEKAVESALMQPEAGEVLFIDDGSTDNSLAIGHQLAAKDSRVRVFQQPDGRNLGAGAARNIGLKNAQFEYIAFLDSDDFFVENRFEKTKVIFAERQIAEGVYEAVKLLDAPDLKKHSFSTPNLITFTKKFPPQDFFHKFLMAKTEFCSIVGLTIRASVLPKVGLFDENLRQGQDVDFMLRLGLETQLFPGKLTNPVAIIGNHNERSVYNAEGIIFHRRMLFEKWFKKIFDNNWSKKVNRHILINHLHFHTWTVKSWNNPLLRWIKKSFLLAYNLLKKPKLFFKIFFL